MNVMKPSTAALPGRDFSKLKAGHDLDAAAKDIFAQAIDLSKAFAEKYQGKVSKLGVRTLIQALQDESEIDLLVDRGEAIVYLVHTHDLKNQSGVLLRTTVDEQRAKIDELTSFFDAELAALGAKSLEKLANTPMLKPWRQIFLDMAESAKHALPPEQEKLLAAINADAAWYRLYDAATAALKFKVGDQTVEADELYPMIESPDLMIRRNARTARTEAYSAIRDHMAAIYDEIVRLSSIEDEFRSYDRPEAASLFEAGLSAEALDALISAAGKARGIVHEWYLIQAEELGIATPGNPADFYGPVRGLENLKYSWAETVDLVRSAWKTRLPNLANHVDWIFNNNLVDAQPRPGKESGAYCLSDFDGKGPFVHMSFNGTAEDVLTLAHEVGHGVHGMLLNSAQPIHYREPGRVMSETASTFSEGIVFDLMVERAPTREIRRGLIGSMLQERFTTSLGQISFHQLEARMHRLRENEVLTADIVAEEMLKQSEWLNGPAMVPDGADAWPRLWHVFHAPFYCWTYAAADVISSALLNVRRRK